MRRKEERMSAFLLADDESDDDYVYNHSAREGDNGDNDADTLHISLDRFISSSSSSSSSFPPPSLSLWPFFLVSVKRLHTDLYTVLGSRLTLLLPLMLVKLALETSHQRRSCSNMRRPKCTESEYRSSQRRKLAPARDNNKSTPKHYLHRRRKSLEAFLVNDSIDSNHGGKLNIICSIDAYCLKNA